MTELLGKYRAKSNRPSILPIVDEFLNAQLSLGTAGSAESERDRDNLNDNSGELDQPDAGVNDSNENKLLFSKSHLTSMLLGPMQSDSSSKHAYGSVRNVLRQSPSSKLATLQPGEALPPIKLTQPSFMQEQSDSLPENLASQVDSLFSPERKPYRLPINGGFIKSPADVLLKANVTGHISVEEFAEVPDTPKKVKNKLNLKFNRYDARNEKL